MDESQHDRDVGYSSPIDVEDVDVGNDCDWGDEDEAPDPRVAVVGYN